MWKPLAPIVLGELVNGLFLNQAVVMTEEEAGQQFLISKSRS
jgi:hypothetical protein